MVEGKIVEVFGLKIPCSERVTVEERQELEIMSAEAGQYKYADSRSKYEAVRIFAKLRLKKTLPEWLSKEFNEKIEPYFEQYDLIEEAATDLLQPFFAEQDRKKARRQAKALEASGSADELRALIRATELVLEPMRAALARLESDGHATS